MQAQAMRLKASEPMTQSLSMRTCPATLVRFCHERLASLVRTLELNNIDEFSSLQRITNFATLIGTYQKGEGLCGAARRIVGVAQRSALHTHPRMLASADAPQGSS